MSLKAKALQILAQRDHSSQELRLKLLRWEPRSSEKKNAVGSPAGCAPDSSTAAPVSPALKAQIDALVETLVEADLLSDERFAENRAHARQARFGNRRIEQELRQHGLKLAKAQLEELRTTEAERASHVLKTRFAHSTDQSDDAPTGDRQKLAARQQRFLAARGFTADAIRHAMKEWRADAPA